MQILEQVPDGYKVAASVAAPALTLFGVTLEEWTFILSAIVSVLFIIEKLPKVVLALKQLKQWIKRGTK